MLESFLKPKEAVGLQVSNFILRAGKEFGGFLSLHRFRCFLLHPREIAHNSPPSVVLLLPKFRERLRLLLFVLAFWLELSLCYGMPHRKQAHGDTLVTAREVATYSVTKLRESTILRWMTNGVTSFGMPLDVSLKDDHLVMSLFEVGRLQEAIQRREAARFARMTDELETELRYGLRSSCARKPKATTPQP